MDVQVIVDHCSLETMLKTESAKAQRWQERSEKGV